ncbi:OmpL47-type beta-barrel domain-containing protein [Microbacterium pumilum]|uniref:OmpL47-type beta-barrel domain-containing protein n=1 Tax=Microbacterium pumilum TaxID=344165 RepID=UPI0031DF5A17
MPLASPVAATNLSFEQGLTGWTPKGTVSALSDGHAQDGSGYVRLAAGASITQTVTGIPQGSYTLAAWVDGSKSNNAAALTASATGAPDAIALLDVYLPGNATWAQAAHRNVLVYNGQVTVTITAGTAALNVDALTLTLDSQDENPLQNWGFDTGLTGWTANDGAKVTPITEGADSGAGAVQLAAGGEVGQTVPVEPNTRYIVSARTKVQRADTYTSTAQTDQFGSIGTLVTRMSTGNRVNIGIRGAGGAVLRQAPAGSDGWSLVTASFTTGSNDHQVTIYANTIADQAYRDSVGVFTDSSVAPADDWSGNGSDNAWVDNFDIFSLDDSYLRGADVSNLQVLEDNEGKFFVNGVQQDALRILSNRGVNSITSMIFVHAGQVLYDASLNRVKVTDGIPGGGAYPDTDKRSWDGYFDKLHSAALAERAHELGLSYLPSFHLSDSFISSSKAFTPLEWIKQAYDGKLANSDLAHIRSAVYNYVTDTLTAIRATGVEIVGVKQGNEQNGGLVWPIGQGETSTGHAAIITAINDALRAVTPEVPGYAHTANGYSTTAAQSFFKGLINNGAKIDGASFSLYGGRASANILNMAETINGDPALRYLDYVNVETAVSFTNYKATWASDNVITPEAQYYARSVNGQYNWLLDYMQAPFDVPNPYGQTRGFYYWEIDWIPVSGIGSKQGVPADVSTRTMFNNGNPAVIAAGSAQPGKSGDALDSLNAYLMRGTVKSKPASMQTPLNEPGVHAPYAVAATPPTGITLIDGTIDLTVGDRQRLQPVVSPTDQVLTDSDVTYSSADKSVATVSRYGYVVGIASGTTTVTATDASGNVATASVTVSAPFKAAQGDLTVTSGTTTLTDGQTLTVKALDTLQLTSTLATSASDRMLTFTSSDPSVASFFGETWQTPKGKLRAYSGTGNTVQLNVRDAGSTDLKIATADGGTSITVHVVSTKVAVTGITLDKPNAAVAIGATASLGAHIVPSTATLYRLTWSSANPLVAKVDASGVVTGVADGQTTITAVSQDNPAVSTTATVTVSGVKATSLTFVSSDIRLQTGSTRGLQAVVLPADADGALTWASSTPAVATVDAHGKVTAVAAGTTDITATTTDGSALTATARVTVTDAAQLVTGLVLDATTHVFRSDFFADEPVGSAPTRTFALTVQPAAATNADIVWRSDTPDVATVDATGKVTAVSAGVARITAATRDGGVATHADVYVPTLSETFESRGTTYTWGLTQAASVPVMTARVTTGNGGKALVLTSRSGTGASALQKVLAHPVTSSKIVTDFTYNVGTPGSANGAYLALTDSAGNRYLTLRYVNKAEIAYGTGGQLTAANSTALVGGMANVGTGFATTAAWYRVHAEIDTGMKEVTFTLTARDNASVTATRTVPFDPNTDYAGDLGRFQFWTTGSGSGTWFPALDDVVVYGTAAEAKKVEVDKTTIRLLPVTDTLAVSHRLTASVVPATASQELTWTSSDEDAVKVTDNGLVYAAHTYDSLGDVVPAEADITVASKSNPTVKAVVHVIVTDTPHASEQFAVVDDDGATVFPNDDSISLESSEEKNLIAKPTGGDGLSDIANVEWSSSDPTVATVTASVDSPATAEVHGVKRGSAYITVKLWVYGDPTPISARMRVDVDGGGFPPAAIEVPQVKVTGQDVQVSWTAPDDGDDPITGYEITLTPQSGPPLQKSVDGSITSVIFQDAPGGSWTARVKATNSLGTSESPATAPFLVDTTDPVVVATVSPASPTGLAGWYTGAVSVALAATDDSEIDSIEYRIGAAGAWTVYEGPVAAPQGASLFGYRATDTAGNVSAVQSVSVQRDTVAPAASAVFDDADGTTEGPVAVTLSATDAASGVDTISYSVDGGSWLTYSGPVSVAGAGEHEVSYRAIDIAGNAGQVESASVTIVAADTTAPVVVAKVNPANPTGDAGWYTGTVSLTLSATDDRSGVASVQYRIGSGDWATYTAPIVLDEGSTTVSYRATDGKGNVSDPESVTVKRDGTAPVTAATFDDDSGASTGPVAVTLSATDAGSGVGSIVYSLDGGAWTTYTTPVSVSGAGTHTIAYEAVDVAGNVSAVKSATIQIAVADTEAPVVTAATAPAAPSGQNGWYTGAVSVSLSAVDERSAVASIEYRLSGGAWTTYTTAIVVPEGAVEVEYRATDAKGNVSAPETVTVKRDATAPVSVASFDDQDGQATGPVEVTLSSTDGGSGVQGISYSVNGGANTPYTGAFEVAANATITFAGTDKAGNVEQAKSATVTFAPVDSTPPVVNGTTTPGTPNGANGWFTSPVTLTLTATDTQSGIEAITYRAGSGAFTTYSGPIAVPVGTTVYTFRAADGKGNVSGFKTITVKRDEDAPAATSTAAAVNTTSSKVTLAATDAVSGVASITYRVDSGSWKTYTAPFTITGAGVHTVEYSATDTAGNAGAVKTSQVLVGPDTSAPLLSVATTPVSPNGANGWFTGTVTVAATATDVSGVARTEYRIGTGAWTVYTAPISAPAGTTTYGFRSTDTKGNVSAIKTITVKRDTTAPVTTATFNDLDGASSAPVKVTLTRTDTPSGVGSTWYQVDGGTWTQYSAAFYVDGAGDRVVTFASTDLAGNTEAVKTVTVRIASPDTTAPVLSVTTTPDAPTGLNSWFTGTVSLKATATDPTVPGAATSGLKSVAYKIGTGTWTVYTAPLTAPSGTTTYSFRATDKAGNIAATQTVVIKRDIVVPVATASFTNGGVGTVPVTLTATDATSGVGQIVYSLDQGPWITYTGAIPVTGAGSHSLYYSAIDNAGNTSATKTATITVVAPDTTGPTVSAVISPAAPTGSNGWYKGTAAVTLAITATDPSGVASREYQVNGGAWKPYTVAISVPAGQITWTYRATDIKGNVSQVKTIVTKRDTASPVTAAAFTNSQVGTVPVTLTATDPVSGVGVIKYSLDQGAWTTYAGPVPVTGKGTHTLSYTATDNAGNTSAAKSASITVK